MTISVVTELVSLTLFSYSAYYNSPIGLDEPNPNYINLQQAIERIRQAFIQNNELEK